MKEQCKSAVFISRLVTVLQHSTTSESSTHGWKAITTLRFCQPALTGVPFNDAYRYMDQLSFAPLLLMELLTNAA